MSWEPASRDSPRHIGSAEQATRSRFSRHTTQVGGRVWSERLANGALVEHRGGEFVLEDYEVLRGYLAELGLELADTGMSYYVREPREGEPTTLAELSRRGPRSSPRLLRRRRGR